MKVKPIIEKYLINATGTMHKTLLGSLSDCIHSVVNGAPLTVTGIGRGID